MTHAVRSSLIAMSFLGFATVARADEKKIDLKDVPKAVADAVKAKFPNAQATGAEKETEDGKTTFEVAIKDGDKKREVGVSADGKILEVETAIEAGDLPRAVTAALAKKYPDAKVKGAEEVIGYKNGTETKSYEVEITSGEKKTIEVMVSADGKTIKQEEEGEDDDKDEKDDER